MGNLCGGEPPLPEVNLYPDVSSQVKACLLDQKYILSRFLLIRVSHDKYFCEGYDRLRELALQ